MSQNWKRQLKELQFLYNWLQIARKGKESLKGDIKMIFDLIRIPISDCQIELLERVIDPERRKERLEREDFIKCFSIEQECKKPKEKQLIKAFKYVSGDKQQIQVEEIKKYFKEEGICCETSQVIINQLDEYIDQNGSFDYKRFAGSIY